MLAPPPNLTVPCPVPPLKLTTWGMVVEEDMPALITALRECDARMDAVRQWVSTTRNSQKG
ncbi:hypothetical protein D3C77_320080 [compost metagenome]